MFNSNCNDCKDVFWNIINLMFPDYGNNPDNLIYRNPGTNYILY